jgi:hypothetical protein
LAWGHRLLDPECEREPLCGAVGIVLGLVGYFLGVRRLGAATIAVGVIALFFMAAASTALLLLAAAHYLLLRSVKPRLPLAAYYPSIVGPAARCGDPVPAFRRFCLERQGQIRELVATRRVQTNEVGRCACLLPAFTLAAGMAGGRPLALVEVGASAGLNLLFDRYAYDYGDGVPRGEAGSPVRISCSLRGPAAPLARGTPWRRFARAWTSTPSMRAIRTPDSGNARLSGRSIRPGPRPCDAP